MCEPVCGGQIREPASLPAQATDRLTACFNVLTLGRFGREKRERERERARAREREKHIDSSDVRGHPGLVRHHYCHHSQARSTIRERGEREKSKRKEKPETSRNLKI